MVRPSGLTATARTQSVWPSRERSRRPLSASHTFTVRSHEPLTMVRPSGLTATVVTSPYGLQGAQQAPALGLPHLHRAVIRPADDGAPVGADRHGPHPIRMAFQGAQQAPALGLPHLHRAVITSR
jgi:hypothetical protein